MSKAQRTSIGVLLVLGCSLATLTTLLSWGGVSKAALYSTACQGTGGPQPTSSSSSSSSPSASSTASPLVTPLPTLPTKTPLPTSTATATPSSSASPTSGGGGGGKICSTEISLVFKRKGFSGTLDSDDDYCIAGRKVAILQDRKGKKDLEIGDAVSDDAGKYAFPAKKSAVQGKKYYSKTPNKPASDSGTSCKAAKSNVVKP